MIKSPYYRWNLRRNPFGELTRQERAELAVVEQLDRYVAIVQSPKAALQFVGDCGFGKTSHLLALLREIPTASYVYFPEDGPRPSLPRSDLLLIDEAQRMGFWRFFRMIRSSSPIVLGTHVDFTRLLSFAGFKVTTIDVCQEKTPAQLAEILNRRIRASQLSSRESRVRINEAFASHLLSQFGSNVRAIESHLYTQFHMSVMKGLVWPPAI